MADCTCCHEDICPEVTALTQNITYVGDGVELLTETFQNQTGSYIDLANLYDNSYPIKVFRNGVLQLKDVHYTLSTVSDVTRITFDEALTADEIIQVEYASET